MPFEKGNPGRPKGSKNKFKLTTIREVLQESEVDLAPFILKEIMALENRETRVTMLMRFYSWVEPRTQKIDNANDKRSGYPSALPQGDEGAVLNVLKPYEQTANG